MENKLIGCYIHIPFCNKICSYCDFSKIYYKKDIVDKYIDELLVEIDNSYNNDLIDTLYIGGGTPSSLNIKQLNKLLNNLHNKLNLSKLKEYTIECNFDSIDYEKLDLFKKYGVNRLSFGLESINKDNLKVLEREIDKDKVKDIIKYCHKIGIDNINIDLMYAIPNETKEVLKKDIEFIKKLDITHISTYSLILEEHTKLYINNIKYIDEDLDREMYDLICDELKEYDHYEISNFAKSEEYESIHNLKYWNNYEYYGYGLGSSGYEGHVRYTKTRSINKYLNGDYIKEDGIEYLTDKDKIYYQIIMNLRTKYGIDLREFERKYKSRLDNHYNYLKLVEEGLLEINNNHVTIPKKLWYISNSVIVRLLEEEV